MAGLDSRIVSVSLPTLATEFETDLAGIQWIITVYNLTFVGLMLLFGKVGDQYGKEKVFGYGFMVFTVGSLLSGFSTSLQQIITFRIIQGVGGAIIAANGQAIAATSLPEAQRGKALGIAGLSISAGLLSGPALGGLAIDLVSWHWIFFFNVPIGIFASYISLRYLFPLSKGVGKGGLDYLGAALMTGALAFFLYGFDVANSLGWITVPTVASFGFGIVLLLSFIAVERRVATPLVDLKIFKIKRISMGLLASSTVFFAQSVMLLLVPFYLQLVLGLRPTIVGLLLMSTPVISILVAPISGSLSDRIGTFKPSLLGICLTTMSLVLLSTLGREANIVYIVSILATWGFGLAAFLPANNNSILGAAPRDSLGITSASLRTLNQVSSALGVAMGAALFTFYLSLLSGMPRPELNTADPEAFLASLRMCYLAAAGVTSAGIVASYFSGKDARAHLAKSIRLKNLTTGSA